MENSCLGLFFLLVVSQITSCESFRFLATEKAVVAVLPIKGPPRCTFLPGTRSDRFQLRPLDAAPLSVDILTAKFGFEVTVEEGYKTAAVVVRAAIVRNVIGNDLSVPTKSKALSVKTAVKEIATGTAKSPGKLKDKAVSIVKMPSSVAKTATPSIAKGIEGATVTSKVARTSKKKGAVAPVTVKGTASIPGEVPVKMENKKKSRPKTKPSAALTAVDLKENKDKPTGKPLKPVATGLTSPAAATDKSKGKGKSKSLTVAAASSVPPSAKASSKKGTGTASSTALDVHPLVPKRTQKKVTTVTTTATTAAAATLATTKGKSTSRSVPKVIIASTATALTPIEPIDKTSKSKSKAPSRKKSRTTRASVRAPMTGEIEGEKKDTWANAKVG